VELIQVNTMDNEEVNGIRYLAQIFQEDLWVNEELCPKIYSIEREIKASLNWTQQEANYRPLKVKLASIFNISVDDVPEWGSKL
jgi:hypothetical protein